MKNISRPVLYVIGLILAASIVILLVLTQSSGQVLENTGETDVEQSGEPVAAPAESGRSDMAADDMDSVEQAASDAAPDLEEAEAAMEMEEGEADAAEEMAAPAAPPTLAATAPAALEAAPPADVAPEDAMLGESADGEVGTSSESDRAEPDMLLPAPTPSPAAEAERRLGAPAPLKAGEINDNEQFQAYLDYLADFHGAGVLRADVSERYIISVLGSDQQPYMDATVRVYDEQNQMLFEGRTYAGGQTIFLPGVLEVSPNVQQFRVVAEHGNASTETMLERGQQERLELSLESEQSPDELRLDVLFLLDTTGSMADELNRIQETIDSIAQRIDAFEPRPTLRFGLVAYRDQGDDYVTRDYNFTEDVGAFRDVLDTFDADGGGDTPEALEAGLHQSIHNLQWSDNGVRLIFLVADAGPQLHRHQNYTYLSDAQQAVAQGIKIYPIAASNTEPNAEYVFRQLAQQTMGSFIFLTYQAGASGGAPGEQRDDLAAGTESQYTVERLDDLIVQVVQRELAAAVGAR